MDLVKPNLVGGFRHPFEQHMRQVKLDHLPRDRDEFNLNIYLKPPTVELFGT